MRIDQRRILVVLCIVAFAVTDLSSEVLAEEQEREKRLEPQPSGDAAKKQADNRVEAILAEWEVKRKRLRDIRCEFKKTTLDYAFQTEEVEEGEAVGAWPNLLRVEVKDAKRQAGVTTLSTNNAFRVFWFEEKTELVYDMSVAQREALLRDDKLGFFDRWGIFVLVIDEQVRFAFLGVPPTVARSRFKVCLIKENAAGLYLRLEPRMPVDRKDLKSISLVLDKETYVAWHTRYVQPNGNDILWSLQNVRTNLDTPISEKSLAKDLPEGWTQLVTKPEHFKNGFGLRSRSKVDREVDKRKNPAELPVNRSNSGAGTEKRQ